MPDAPTIISTSMVAKAVTDPKFYNALPEFLSISMKLKASHEPELRGGCGGCRRKRMAVNVFQDFVAIVAGLAPDATERLKQYLGIKALMYHGRDAQGRMALKIS